MTQLVRLEWHGITKPVHCPKCGTAATADDACPHLLFIYGASEGEFVYLNDGWYDKVEAMINGNLAEDADEGEEPETVDTSDGGWYNVSGLEDSLVELTEYSHRMTFEIVNEVVPNRPIYETQYIGFDFAVS